MPRPPTPCPRCRRLRCTHPRRKQRVGPHPYDRQWRKVAAQAIAQHPWCSACGTRGDASNPLTGDHIVPLSLGGTHAPSNVGVLCRRCNVAKGGRNRLR